MLLANSSLIGTERSRLLDHHRQIVLPPLTFACVSPGIYRSGYPIASSLPFLSQLKLKTMICLCPGDLKQEIQQYAASQNIRFLSFDIRVNQEPFISMDADQVSQAVEALSNLENHPVLLFCLNGKVKTSVVVSCLRKVRQHWSMASILEEFELFAEPEGGLIDISFIERFEMATEILQDETVPSKSDVL